MARLIRLLVVEDNRNDAELIVRELRSAGFEPAWQRVETEEEFLAHLQTEIDVVLSDFRMPQFDALRALELLKQSKPEIPFIIVSGTVGDELAATAMKEGAADYLLKDRLARLGLAVSQALEQSRLRKEQKRAEEALRESEARFRELAENIQEIFWLTDPEKDQVLYISPAYETIWGRPRSEVYATPRSWVEGVHPDDRYRVLRAAVTQQVTGTYDEEYRVVHPDGSVRWIHDRAFPVRNAAGEVLRIVGIADNITDRKRAEDAMRASNERFGSFMDNLPGLAWIKDTAGRYVYANKPFREQLVAGRDWYRKTDGELWRPEPAATYQANDRKVIETRAPLQTTEKITHARGERIGLTSKFPILDASGNVAFICGICIDITERQQAEERLSKSEARLAKAEQLAHLGSWDWDVSTDLVSWSEEMFRLVGHSPRKEPVDFQFSLACVHPEDRARYSELTQRAIQHGQPYVCECRVVRPDGTVRMLYNQGTVVRDEQGRATRMFGTAQDITERHRAEQLLRESESQLRALADRLVTVREDEAKRIARELHDEMGQALTGLKLDVTRIQTHLSEGSELSAKPELEQRLNAMSRAIDHTVELTRKICAELRPGVLDELGLVAALEWQAHEFEARTGMFCNLSLPDRDPPLDAQRATTVFRIFQEVLTNVARHTEATEVDVSLKAIDHSMELTVTDNGRGISEAEIAQAKGLGLLGMRERALAAGGSVTIRGEPGKGTTVVLRLPIEGNNP